MTTSWATVQNAIKSAVEQTGAVVAGAVTWVDEPRPAAGTMLILDIVYDQVMQDRQCRTENLAVPGTFLWTLSTLYYIRVQVRAEAVFNAPGSDARFALEKVRAGLLRPDIVFPADVVLQSDESTYVHHVSFPHQGRTISAYAFELGFRAVIDYPLGAPAVAAEYNMQRVELELTEIDVGEFTPVDADQEIDRPI